MVTLWITFQLLFLLSIWAPSILADVEFLQPTAGKQVRAGTARTVSWTDSGESPPLADLTNYVLNLCAGGNSEGSYQCPLAVLKTGGTFAGSNIATELQPISPAVGGNSVNGYFLQMESTTASGAKTYNYSPRFGITGMRGDFTAQVQAGITAAGDTTQGPSRSKDKAEVIDTVSSIKSGDVYAVLYPQQEGTIRYAPMQPQPPTRIVAQVASPQWPMSHVPTLATTFLPRPSIVTTITQAQTHSVRSRENTASPAPDPNDDMAKWLARWKD